MATAALAALLIAASSLQAADPFAAAAKLYQQGRWKEAAAAFEAIRGGNANAEQRNSAAFYLGECRMQTEEYPAARAAFQYFLKQAPRHKQAIAAKFRLAEAAYLQGDRAVAQAELTQFVAGHPNDPRLAHALPFLGHLALQQNDPPAALQWLNRAESEFPNGPLKKEVADWKQQAQALAAPPAKPLPLAPPVSLAAPAPPSVSVPLAAPTKPSLPPPPPPPPAPSVNHAARDRDAARALLRQGKFAEAVQAFERLLNDGSDRQLTVPPQEIANDRYWLALAHLGAKQYDAALKALEPTTGVELGNDLAAGIELARATSLLALQHDRDAVAPLREYLKRLPTGQHAATCRADLATTLARLGEWENAAQAEADFSAQHPNDPRRPTLLAALAEAAVAAEQFVLARRWVEALQQIDPNSEATQQAQANLAWITARAASPAEAAAALEKFLDQAPNSQFASRARLLLGGAWERDGKLDAAIVAYQRLIDGPPDAVELPFALLGAARVHDRLAQDREADVLLARLDRDFPKFAERDALLYLWGWVLQDLDRRDESLAAWRKLHELFPASRHWAETTYRLAEHELNEQRPAQAQVLAQKAIAAKPSPEVLARTLLLLGQAAALERDWNAARPPLERLLSEFPQAPQTVPAEFWLAEADYRTSHYAEAASRLDRLAGRTAEGKEPWMAMIPLRRSQILARKEKWAEAREMAATVGQRFPEFRQLYEADYVLGRAAAALGEFTTARAAYDRVIASPHAAKTETAAMSQWMIGETYFHQQRWDDALKAYQRVEILYTFPAWQAAALLQAGKCLEQKGDNREAAKVYGRLLEQHPATSYASEARKRIEIARERSATKR